MLKHLKRKRRFLSRLHEIEEDRTTTTPTSTSAGTNAAPGNSDESAISDLRDALSQMKGALSESTTDKMNMQKLLDEQLSRLGKSLEETENKTTATAAETANVVASLESELQACRRRLAEKDTNTNGLRREHEDAIQRQRAHHERQMKLLQDQYEALRERHQTERQAHVAQHDRLQELLRLRTADVDVAQNRIRALTSEVQDLRKQLVEVQAKNASTKGEAGERLVKLSAMWHQQQDVFAKARRSHMVELMSLEKLLRAQQTHLLSQCTSVSSSNLALRASEPVASLTSRASPMSTPSVMSGYSNSVPVSDSDDGLNEDDISVQEGEDEDFVFEKEMLSPPPLPVQGRSSNEDESTSPGSRSTQDRFVRTVQSALKTQPHLHSE